MKKGETIIQKQEVAARLRGIRVNSGYTQERFAEILDISVSAYKKLESAENQVSVDCLAKIEKQLKVSSDYILFGEQQNREEVWKAIINCSEKDKMYLLFRLVNYFTRLSTAKFLTQDVQAIYDKEFLEVLKEVDI